MKNHRFLWLRNRTTDNRKCEKARNIKEKRTIEMFSTASKPPVAHLSSPRDKLPHQEARSRSGFGLLSLCLDANLTQIEIERENSTVPPAASPANLPVSQNSRTPPQKSVDALRSVADHTAAHTLRSMGGHCFFPPLLWSGGETRGRKTGDEGREQASQPCVAVSNLFFAYYAR